MSSKINCNDLQKRRLGQACFVHCCSNSYFRIGDDPTRTPRSIELFGTRDEKEIQLERHVYRLKWWAQTCYLAIGLIFGGVGVAFIVMGFAERDWTAFMDLRTVSVMVFPTALGYLFLALALRSRVVLEDSRISVRYTWREKSANISEIEGYRVLVTKNATVWRLELKEDRGSISIMRAFRMDDDFRVFLSQLKNLDGDQDLAGLHC
jgi:hypothetical protein